MLKDLQETMKKLEDIKTTLNAVAELLNNETFNKEDTIKVLKRISDSI